jgi:carbon-monoxide dehydrogenase large subunit
VKWCATRSEEFLSGSHGRGASLEGELAASADGRILGLRARLDFPLGHWLPFSAAVPANNAGRILPGPYRVDAVDIDVSAAIQKTAAVGIYRGAGRPEAAMLMERLVDAASRSVGLDPIEFRRRNLLASEDFPYRTPTGQVYDSGDFERLLERTCSVSCYPELVKEKAERRARGEKYGLGVAFYVEPCGSGWESARIHLARDGTIVAATGTSAQGQGRETTFAQIVAKALNVGGDRIVVRHGDTELCPPGIGALASRSTAIGGVALLQAATDFGARARDLAGRMLALAPERLVSTTEGFGDGNGRLATWPEIAELAWADTNNEKPGLETTSIFHAEGEAWSSGCCLAAVSVDADTGVPTVERIYWVDDAGTIISPQLAEGQLIGGMAQGVGEALLERLVYDEHGQLGTGSLMDYAVPRAHHVPSVVRDSLATPARTALGAKGVGEAGSVGIPAAIVNGIMDALMPIETHTLTLPLTSARIWELIRAGNKTNGEHRP